MYDENIKTPKIHNVAVLQHQHFKAYFKTSFICSLTQIIIYILLLL